MNYIKSLLLFALSALMLLPTSCVQEEPAGSKAIIPDEKDLVLPASAVEQPFTIYADGEWEADVTDTWLSINPTTGYGTVAVVLSVDENPGITNREAKIIIKGGSRINPIEVTVTQKGDRFKNETAKSVTEATALSAGSLVKLAESQVVALAKDAFIVTDGTSMILVQGKSDVKAGSKVTLIGDVVAVNGISAIKLDEILSSTEATYTPSEPKDITNESSYAPGKVEFVKLEAVYSAGGKFQVAGADVAVPFIPAVSLSALANHNVSAVGYAVGQIGGLTALHVTAVEDLGEAEIDGVVFEDNFDWFAELATALSAGDAVGTDNPSTTAPNVFTMDGSADFLAAFAQRGYKFLFGMIGATEFVEGPDAAQKDSRVMYLQTNYLKFGKTSWNGALRLPAFSKLDAPTDLVVEFDWCWQVTGEYKPDLMTLQVDATVGTFADSGAGTTLEIESAQSIVDTESHLAWQHVTLVLQGATSETVLTIRPTNADPTVQNSARKQNRWYLDNIKVTKSEGSVPTPPAGGTQTIATFPFPYDTEFNGTGEGAGTKWNLDEGWLLSEDGKAKLSMHTADGTSQSVTYRYEASSDEGKTKDHVRILTTGMPKDSYWLFEVPVKDMPAGKYNIAYNQSSSASGPNYFLMEVSVDGKNWAPAAAQTTTETYPDGTNGREVTWTYALNKGGVNAANVAYPVNVSYSAPALAGEVTLYIRAKVADDMRYSANNTINATSGTNRIWGPCTITFEQ